MTHAKQCDRVYQYMRDTGPLTASVALRVLGVGRLAARIHELRDGRKMVVRSERILVNTRHGKTYVAQYSLGRSRV